MPVNFLTDGKIIKGYNEAGRLVAVYDMYENYAVIEYEKYYVAYKSGYRIARVYDNKNQQIIFTYTPKNYLSSITDTRGRRTEYAYDDTKLARVTYATGEEMTIAYYGNDIMSIWETKKDLHTELNRSGNKLVITQKTRTENTELSAAEITFTQNSDLRMNYATIKEEKTRERYYFNGARNCREYRLEENGVVTKAEQYEYVPYWNGTTAQTDPRSVRKTAKKTGLYQATLEAYTFPTQASEYDQETTTLDQFNNAKQTTTSALQMNASGSNTQTTVVDYTYDDNQKLVEERMTVTYIDPAKTFVSYKKYTYNVMGDIVRKESYVEGEEYTTGKTIEETVYDDKGNVIKSYTYNSLDTSSKFYTETEYDENGKTVAKYDETGENKTKYEYVAGTSVVGEETLANGSKFAYGREMDGTVTAISQSTEEGEENSTQKVYKHGLVAELRSGNNVVQYTYDDKRRLSSVNLNGTENYVKYEYSEEILNGKTVDKVVMTNAKEETFKSYTDKSGNLMQMNFGDTVILQYTYNERNQLTNLVDADAGITHTYQYDTLYRLEKHTFGLYRNNRSYNTYGQVENLVFGLAADTTNDLLKYVYTYATDSKRELKGMSVAGFIEEYKTDTLGRNKKISQTLGGNTYTKQYGYYKIGDHATNRINTIMFGRNGVTDGKITYTYDEMGNVVSVNENGKQTRKYEYDKLCRLIKEKVLDKETEICYTYDNQGNILTKMVNGEATEYRYKEGTDKLISFGTETFEYDDVGNPKTFRGMEATWEKGRRLKTLQDGTNTVSYTYDGGGLRRTKTVGGVTTTYIYENGKLLREERTDNKIIDYIRGKEGVIGIRVNASNYLFRKNIFGDVTHIYNETGELVGKYSYTAFGECTIETDVGGIASDNPIRYRGYYYDEETNLYYLKSRYYDPELGRFMTIDDISYLDPETINGLNLYAYCGNNPVMNVDPNGNAWWHWLAGALAVVGVALVVAAITVLTAGVGTALAGTMAGAVIYGAAQGIVIGAAVGTAVGGIIGGATSGWTAEGILTGMGIGLGAGSIIGGVIGGFAGASSFTANSVYITQNGGNVKEVLSAFKGNPKLKTLKVDTTVFRTWGGSSPKYSHWVSPKNYGVNARKMLALPPSNTMANTSTFIMQKGNIVLQGKVAAMFGQTGGGLQWWVALLS